MAAAERHRTRSLMQSTAWLITVAGAQRGAHKGGEHPPSLIPPPTGSCAPLFTIFGRRRLAKSGPVKDERCRGAAKAPAAAPGRAHLHNSRHRGPRDRATARRGGHIAAGGICMAPRGGDQVRAPIRHAVGSRPHKTHFIKGAPFVIELVMMIYGGVRRNCAPRRPLY